MHIFVVKHPSAPTSTILVLQFTIIQILKQKSNDKWGTPGSAYHMRDTREAWEWGYGNVDGMPIFVWVLISTPCSGCNPNRCSYSWCLWMYVGIPWVCGDTRSMRVGGMWVSMWWRVHWTCMNTKMLATYVTHKGFFTNAIFSVKYTFNESDIVFHQHNFQSIHCLWMCAGRCVCAVYMHV